MAYKLDLLFQTQSEDIVLKEFRRLKELLNEHINAKDLFQEFYDKQNKIVKLEVEGEEKDNGVFKLKQELINEKQQQLNKLVSEFKKIFKNIKKMIQNPY